MTLLQPLLKANGHNIKWDHFDILAKGKIDFHCKIKETLFIKELKPAFNFNVRSEKLMLYVIFQKRVRVFHQVSKREKHLKPRGRRLSGFIVFERLET